MRQIILLVCLIAISVIGWSQPVERTESLTQLEKPTRFVAKYVNFDVVKVMYGHGWSPDNYSPNSFGRSYTVQLLWPVALLKNSNFIHIAYGISFGRNRVKRRDATYTFTDNELTGIVPENDVRRSIQKTGHIGLVVMPFFTLGNLHVMTGISARFTTIAKLKTIYTDGKLTIYDGDKMNPVAFPLLLQISHSPNQLMSYGLFGSYDLQKQFKGAGFDDVRQLVAGISVAVRI